MLPKILLLVSCLYIVQATFVINAPDDSSDDLNVKVQNNEDSLTEADQGTPGSNPDQGNKPLDESDADQSDDFKIEDSDGASSLASTRVCTNPACHNFCRSRGYAWGICISAYVCRCYRYGLAFNDNKDKVENAVEINKYEDNNDVSELNDVDANNYAVDFESDEVPSEDTSEAASALAARSCNNSNCNRFCRARGYARGRCVSSRVCRCYRYRTTLWDSEDKAETEMKTNQVAASMAGSAFNGQQELPQENSANRLASLRACNVHICNRNCRALRYDRGICIISRCQCLGRPIRLAFANVLEDAINENSLAEAENDAENEIQTNNIAHSAETFDGLLDKPEQNLDARTRWGGLLGCDPKICPKYCRGLGFTYGTCFLRRCQCTRSGIRSAFANVVENDINDYSIPEADIDNTEPVLSDRLLSEEDVPAPRLTDCVLSWCEQTCRRMGFPGGACVNGRCKCDILRRALPWPIPAPRKDVNMRLQGKCVDYKCAEICRRMHYRGGLCTADSCICFM